MATKDDRPGLLSKVAMFVRNPTKDWSELDRTEQPQESGYDKQALKAMIERKRQNDFVRKREFDQLRKLRNRDPASLAGMAARPSFFQTSVATDSDGRAVTLKKIDEIEAQMSKQWWKGKQDSGTTRNGNIATVQPSHDSRSMGGPSQMPTQSPTVGPELFAPTEAIGLMPRGGSGGDDATHMTAGAQAMADHFAASGHSALNASQSHHEANDPAFSASELFAIDDDEQLTTDPELEEAAIRFANGDDLGAERGLVEALRGDALQPEFAQSWAAALMDFYRATGNRTQFDHAVREFGYHLGKFQPAWMSLVSRDTPEGVATATVSVTVSKVEQDSDIVWRSPAILNLQSMESLRNALSSHPAPWHLVWTQLEDISIDAMPLLGGFFDSMCDEAVALRFTGVDQLIRRLRALTPSGDRSINQDCWGVRLNALRAMHLQDEFELAALDYCVTYEVSPPAWIDARCQFENVGTAASGAGSWNADPAGPTTESMEGRVDSTQTLVLSGSVVGDATQALASLEGTSPGSHLTVSCAALIRVDFSAAGNILNWVAKRQAEGSQVQFRDVHRLVAAFFNVIGINEHARIVPRSI